MCSDPEFAAKAHDRAILPVSSTLEYAKNDPTTPVLHDRAGPVGRLRPVPCHPHSRCTRAAAATTTAGLRAPRLSAGSAAGAHERRIDDGLPGRQRRHRA
ncbi:conserved hypothetical protein [Ricinus communis]|uniref:Uncharacterized protein n=1 Tax=Ricinus communis TaxID=3988 RepID=B9THE7_RICCO|nr:conserved hypothetical protein [Ricinus communis]